jgi:conserved oligomeric Golgi complex subunit 6
LLTLAYQREANTSHQEDLSALRSQSHSSLDALKAGHAAELANLKTDHTNELDNLTKNYEKQLSSRALDLKATQDDLAKAKASLDTSRREIEKLTAQRDEARNGLDALASAAPDQAGEVARLMRIIDEQADDLAVTKDVLVLTKQSIEEMEANHSKELEEAAKNRAEETTALRSKYEQEVQALVMQKTNLITQVSDLEGELTTLRASINDHQAGSHTKSNGVSPSADAASVITKEELARLHEAHNLKLGDLEAAFHKQLDALREELNAARLNAKQMQSVIDSKVNEFTRVMFSGR